MTRQRTNHRGRTYPFPKDFLERLKRLQKESGLTWSEIAGAAKPCELED